MTAQVKRTSWSTAIIVSFFIVYFGYLISSFVPILFPQRFLHFKDASTNEILPLLKPMWREGSRLDLKIELNIVDYRTKSLINVNNTIVQTGQTQTIVFNESLNFECTINLTEKFPMLLDALKKNASVTVIYTFTKLDEEIKKKSHIVRVIDNLVVFRHKPYKPKRVKRKLVKGWYIIGSIFPDPPILPIYRPAASPGEENKISGDIVGYWSKDFVGSLLTDWTEWPLKQVPPGLIASLRHDDKFYLPASSSLQMGRKLKDLIVINATGGNVYFPEILKLKVAPISLPRFLFYAIMEESIKINAKMGVPEKDLDELRYLLTESPPELLLLTVLISFLHLMFDILAFKSEIGFWRKIKSVKGVSIQSLTLSTISQTIVALYLHDNDTTLLVLAPLCFSVIVSFWKLFKSFRLSKQEEALMVIGEEEKMETDSSFKEQKRVDKEALYYMFILLFPIVVSYCTLSLLRDEHYGWYSWLIKSLAVCVYAGGFALMTPQIYLNYKSVNHLDFGALWYRAFNTFIDDFFAFLLPMPTMHRMSVFRDDLVFVIFLIQRWIYPTRGVVNEEPLKQKEEQEQPKQEQPKQEQPKQQQQSDENEEKKNQ